MRKIAATIFGLMFMASAFLFTPCFAAEKVMYLKIPEMY